MNIEIDIAAFQREAQEQNAHLLQRCMFLAGRVTALEKKNAELEELLKKQDNVVPIKKE